MGDNTPNILTFIVDFVVVATKNDCVKTKRGNAKFEV